MEIKTQMNSGNRIASSYFFRLANDIKKRRLIYIMAIPVILYYLIFCYFPMYGVIIAFKNFSIGAGILGSDWVGFKHFISFFKSMYFMRVLTNTVVISITDIIFGFPMPIILALMLNEITSNKFKRIAQTVTYLPYFVSMVVICGIIYDFSKSGGLLSQIYMMLGGSEGHLLMKKEFFVPMFVSTNVWQSVGWGSIIYIAALGQINTELYEAATLDGAGRWKQTIHVTLPGIFPTIVIMLILRLGSIMAVNTEKILLLYNQLTYDVADVIGTFTYRKGLQEHSYSYSSAVGLFNSVLNFSFLILANYISKKTSETSLW